MPRKFVSRAGPRPDRGKQVAGVTPRSSKRPVGVDPGPGGWDAWQPSYSFSKLDLDGPFGWRRIASLPKLLEIYDKLRNFEQRTWAECVRDARKHNHAIELHRLSKPARDRLADLQLDTYDDVLSIRLSGTERVFAIRAEHVAFLLWWDPNHEVCPSNLKHT